MINIYCPIFIKDFLPFRFQKTNHATNQSIGCMITFFTIELVICPKADPIIIPTNISITFTLMVKAMKH